MIGTDDESILRFDFESMLMEGDKSDFDKTSSKDICKFYLKGFCNKGAACPYKHVRPEKAVVCKHWLRGLCKKGDECEFLHEYNPKKMPDCWFFAKYGECSNAECIFLHINPDDKIKPCPWYNRGFCKHGPKCRYKHIKKVACPDYLAGFCLKGNACKFAHPKFDIPKEEEQGMDKQDKQQKKRQPQQQPQIMQIQTSEQFTSGIPLFQQQQQQQQHHSHAQPVQAYQPPQGGQSYQQYQQGGGGGGHYQPQQQQQQYHHGGQQQQGGGGGGQYGGSYGGGAREGFDGGQGGPGKKGYRPLTDVTCYKCGQRGHYANACPTSNKFKQGGGPGPGGAGGQQGGPPGGGMGMGGSQQFTMS